MGRMIGSCTGSQVILELLLNGTSPAAIVCQADEIIALGAIVAEELFDRRLPVVFLEVLDGWSNPFFLAKSYGEAWMISTTLKQSC